MSILLRPICPLKVHRSILFARRFSSLDCLNLFHFYILEFSDQAWCEAKSKSEVTLPRVCTVPFLVSEVVSPTDSPAVRPNFDGFGQARRLDTGESDRGYSSTKRARITRSRDEVETRPRANSRRRESNSTTSRPRDKIPSSRKASTEDVSLDWVRLDHERLTLRAQAIANQRRTATPVASAASSELMSGSRSTTSVVEAVPTTPVQRPPSINAAPRESSAQKPEPKRSEALVPSALNLSEITISMSDLGSSQNNDSNAMDVDNFEDELLKETNR